MRLSEAIRLGAMLHPQCFCGFATFDVTQNKITATCALGAAWEAGYRKQIPVRLVLGIMTKNDIERLSREEIADWVASQEAIEAPASAGAVDPVGEKVTG